MFLRVLGVAVAFCLGSSAQGQSDTGRVRSRDAEVVEVLASRPIYAGTDSVVRRRMLDTLEAQRRFWQQHRPRAYVIRVLQMGGCLNVGVRPRVAGQLLRDQLVVRDTTIVRRDPVPIPVAYEQRCPLPWRVEDLFADLARALADPTASVLRVDYDAAYGFPRLHSVFTGGNPHGSGALVESFAAAP